jgi:prepilin-type N-terminal cleavage/methylation domain-containing protein
MFRRLRPEVDVRDDAGLTLVELMVAIVLFALAATGVAYNLHTTTQSTRDSRMRVQAANLAARELEIVRNQFTASTDGPRQLGATSVVVNPDPLPGGTAGQPLDIDGSKFTVVRTVQWLPVGTGQSACDGGSAVTYPSLAVNVKVTWASMGSTKPVVTNTVLTPPKGTLDSPMGYLAVKVLGADGRGVANLPVQLAGPTALTRNTADDGCAVFAVATMGTYTASVNAAGYVTFDGQPSAAKSIAVTAGTLGQLSFSYDRAVTLQATVATLSGYAVPTPLSPLTLFNSNLPSPFTKKVPSGGATTVVGGLWPFTVGYSVWAGHCNQSDPATAGGQRPASAALTPGATVPVSVVLAPLDVLVVDGASVPLAGATVHAEPISVTGCSAGETPLLLGTTDAAGALKTALPAGSWRLTVDGRSPDGEWPTTPSSLPLDTPSAQTVTVSSSGTTP